MEVADVAPALQERLGPEATIALVNLFDVARREWTADVTTAAVERFERRLSEEVGTLRTEIRSVDANLRLEMANGFTAVRQDMAREFAAVRQETTGEFAAVRQEMAGLRQEMTSELVAVRRDMTGGFTAMHHEIGVLRQDQLAGRFELLKWCFAFWIGQIVAVATIVAVIFRV